MTCLLGEKVCQVTDDAVGLSASQIRNYRAGGEASMVEGFLVEASGSTGRTESFRSPQVQ